MKSANPRTGSRISTLLITRQCAGWESGDQRQRWHRRVALGEEDAQPGTEQVCAPVAMIFLDSFSGDIADLKKGQRTVENALAILGVHPRVSTWDMSEHKWLRDLIGDMKKRGLIVEQKAAYPWHSYAVRRNS